MLEQTYNPKTGKCGVTFVMPEDETPPGVDVYSVTLAGEFNKWDVQETPMLFDEKRCAYAVSLDLDPDRDYQYRYVINHDMWYNDWEADAYTPTGVCDGENCVVHTIGADTDA